jgi:hypothetical protein
VDFQKRVVDVLFRFPKFFENMAGIIKISESNEADGPPKNWVGSSQ